MKKTILVLCAVSALMVAQELDIAGQYKLTGVDVLYTFVSRANHENLPGTCGEDDSCDGSWSLTVTDAYGIGVTQEIAVIPAAVPFTTQAMQLTATELAQIGINLNVTLNEDNTGAIAEGSYYPDVNTITDENGNCVTLQQVLPVTDEFSYTTQDMAMDLGMSTYGFNSNVLGLPGISTASGLAGLGLSGSNTFEDFPAIPTHPTICGPDGNCFPFTTGDCGIDGDDDGYAGDDVDNSDGMQVECCAPGAGLDDGNCGDGTIQMAHLGEANALGFPEYVAGGVPLTGVTGGLFLKKGVNAENLTSVFEGNTDPDFHLQWHGVDGASAGLGCGSEDDCMEDVLVDEDGDGTFFDRDVGIPSVTATYIHAACGYNEPIFGDVSAFFPASCVDTVDVAASGLLMDPSLAQWGNFLTYNAALYAGTAAACIGAGGLFNMIYGACQLEGGDPATCSATADGAVGAYGDCTGYIDANYGADDSDHPFAGPETGGRLTMNFDIPCIGIIEAREVVAEFIEVGGGACGSGDMNADGGVNVLDIVALVNCALGDAGDDITCDCTGDLNADGGINVLDVVALVNCALETGTDCSLSRTDGATSAEFNVIGNEVTMIADGIVGGIQMTLSHGSDFALKLTDGGQFSNYSTANNRTTLIIVNPANDNLFTASGDFTIESIIVSDFTGENSLSASVNMPGDFSISAAYPNPFNPTTQMTLALHAQADVSVKVFNMAGQLVDVITEGQMDRGSYSLTWDGTNSSSGVYFVKTEVGSVVHNQKIMFIK